MHYLANLLYNKLVHNTKLIIYVVLIIFIYLSYQNRATLVCGAEPSTSTLVANDCAAEDEDIPPLVLIDNYNDDEGDEEDNDSIADHYWQQLLQQHSPTGRSGRSRMSALEEEVNRSVFDIVVVVVVVVFIAMLYLRSAKPTAATKISLAYFVIGIL